MKKIFTLILCFVIAFNVPYYGVAENNTIVDESISQIVAVEEDVTLSTQAVPNRIVDGAVYNIINVGSGKYLNVHYGVDANGTNVYQWTADGSVEQKFTFRYNSATNSYKIYAMCSSAGNNRVIDIVRNGASLSHGQNVDIWTPIDDTAQYFEISYISSGKYYIRPKAYNSLYLTAYGNSNGTAGGTTATSAGNVFVSLYDGTAYQQWIIHEVSAGAATPLGYIGDVNDNVITGWAWRSDIPNTPIDVHIYITNISTGAQTVFVVKADIYRSDVQAVGCGNGYHGFSLSMDWTVFPYGTYSVSAYAIGHNGNNPVLNFCPKTYVVANTIGYKGYAVYRDLTFWPSLLTGDWHAGIMNKEYSTEVNCVIDMPGSNSSIVERGWSAFLGGEPYRGTYKPKSNLLSHHDRIAVVAMARILKTKDISYTFDKQLDADLSTATTKIQPDDITKIRCDGLIEYCYEYYGYRIFGSDTLWDISKPSQSNLDHHKGMTDIMPKEQALSYMDLVTNSVPQ